MVSVFNIQYSNNPNLTVTREIIRDNLRSLWREMYFTPTQLFFFLTVSSSSISCVFYILEVFWSTLIVFSVKALLLEPC